MTQLLRPPVLEANAADFFISHSREDGDFADLLKLRIEQEGYSAWVYTQRLRAGEDWRTETDEAIRQASGLIAVMTPSARKSEYVTYEWAFAWGVGVRIIPIVLRPTSLHPRLETLQTLDFTNRATRPWGDLLTVLDETRRQYNLRS